MFAENRFVEGIDMNSLRICKLKICISNPNVRKMVIAAVSIELRVCVM